MKRVVTEGSVRYYTNLSSLGIEVAGKTETAQNPHCANHCGFIAYAPADNPQIAITVLTDNSGYASISSSPVAGLLIEQYLTGEITRQHVLDYVLAFQPSRTETTEP